MITRFSQIEDEAKKRQGRVVVPMANNLEAQCAVQMALEEGWLSGGTLIGDLSAIQDVSAESLLELDKFEIIDNGNPREAAHIAAKLMAEKKGDFLLKGIIDTKDYIRAVMDKNLGLVEEGRLLTHVAIMQVPGYPKLFGMTDVAMCINPGVEEKKKMIKNIVEIFHKLGVTKPKVAMICPVEKVNDKIQSTLDAQAMVEFFKDSPDCFVEGPYDTYIALSRHAAEEKGVKGEVCGDADILIFPDLDSANPAYKLLNQFVPGIKSAAILAGPKVPVMLPSRADSAMTKKLSIALSSFLSSRIEQSV